MKKVEGESFLKSFLLFFLSLSLLNTILFIFEYQQKRHDTEEKILTQMKVCSFDLKCTRFEIDFAPLKSEDLYKLHKDEKGLHSFFSVPGSETYAIKLTLPQEAYLEEIREIQNELVYYYLIVMVCIGILSAAFSLYALFPLKQALHLTEEFSKDILHDFNTPLASLRLNVRMLQCPESESKKIQRIEQSIETILALQENLRSYLEEHQLQKEPFEASRIVRDRIALIRKVYPHIRFELKADRLEVVTNPDAFTRIVDNLLSNAAKYNTEKALVNITLDAASAVLKIADTGKGIVHPERAFERFYKEQDRGIGIGLHIVKKLCDALEIPIALESTVGVGTTFTLDLGKLTLR